MTSPSNGVLVTGGASGIGFDIARLMQERGWQVHLVDLNMGALARACDDLAIPADRAHAASVADEAAMETVIARSSGTTGLGAVVNCAGIGQDTPALDMRIEDFRRMLEVNLVGTFVTARAAARRWLAQGRAGSVVNISSVSGILGSKGRAAYGSSKAAVDHLTRILCTEWAAHGIRVNAVAPGAVDTPLTQAVHTPDVRRQWHERIPQHRYGTTREIAEAVAFLASPEASYVNGQVLAVDGGFSTAGLMVRE